MRRPAARTSRRLRRAVAVIGLFSAAAAAQTEPARGTDPRALRDVRDALIAAADFAGALEPAVRVAELTDAAQSPDAIEDLLYLARIQAELDLFDDAELNYLEAIDRLREAEGEFSPKLVPAYRALGRAYIGRGEFLAAISALEQAQHLSQRGAGLFNLEQSSVLDDMTLAYLGLGDTHAARRLQLERLENAVRQYGEDDPRTVPFRNYLADYYDRSRLRQSARSLYAQSLAVLETAYGELDARLLPTLRALLRVDLALGEERDVPDRISRILDANPGLEPLELSESLAALGDVALVRGATADARAYYARAYDALASEDAAQAAAAFAEPRMLDFVAPLSPVDRAARSRPYAWGTVELELDVTAEGRAENVRAVRIEPSERHAGDFLRRVRETHFRPRLVDGLPARTRGVGFSHGFRYYVQRERR